MTKAAIFERARTISEASVISQNIASVAERGGGRAASLVSQQLALHPCFELAEGVLQRSWQLLIFGRTVTH
jgi:hypothetical protein